MDKTQGGRAHRKRHLVVLTFALTIMAANMLIEASITDADAPHGPLKDAVAVSEVGTLAGKTKLVCGDISLDQPAPGDPSTTPLVLAFDTPPNQGLRLSIPPQWRRYFSQVVRSGLVGREVCVEGKLKADEKSPDLLQIDVTNFSQFKFIGAVNALMPMGTNDPASEAGQAVDPRRIKNVDPVFPQAALAAGVSGPVVVTTSVGIDGIVREPLIVDSRDPLLGIDTSALFAVSQWRYRPAMLHGQPTPCVMTITVTFTNRSQSQSSAAYPIVQTVGITRETDWPSPIRPGPSFVTDIVAPHYPLEALRRNWEGDVTVHVSVGANGQVVGATVADAPTDTPDGVREAAVHCVGRWNYELPKSGDQPQAAERDVVVRFRFHKT